MKTTKYYVVTNSQIMITAILVAVLSTSLVVINTAVKQYFELPLVTFSEDGKCATVSNYKNGEAYTCSDVGVVLRNFRSKKN